MLTSREHQQVAGVPHRFMHFWFWSSILLHKCRSAGSGATSFFTSVEVLRATVLAAARGSVRLAVKPLVLICMADYFREKNIIPWLISQRISWLIRPAVSFDSVAR